jgi:nucleoid DNA-binding protein
MVGKIIRDYIEGGAKKLTVPGFGTFMRRENGGVVFVDLLRGDDTTLSEMVEDTGGYSQLEAMALIDRFIFETRNRIERHGSAAIDGFGTMRVDHKGVFQFDYSPRARAVKETATQERLFEFGGTTPPTARVAAATPLQERRGGSKAGGAVHNGKPKPRTINPQKGKPATTDRVLVIAIVAAAIAIIAMLFGLTSGGHMPFLQQ